MENILTKEEMETEEVKKCDFHLKNYVKCTEDKNIYFKECYYKFYMSFIHCSKMYHKLYL